MKSENFPKTGQENAVIDNTNRLEYSSLSKILFFLDDSEVRLLREAINALIKLYLL